MPQAAGLWYEWHGPEDGEVLILSAGLGGAGRYWEPNLPALSGTYRLLLYDHRGTGRSDPAPAEGLTIGSMAEDVAALAKALGVERAHFLGHAVGGMIGLALSRRHPIARLIVVNGWARLDPHTARCFDVRLSLLRGSGPAAFVRAQPLFLYPAGWISRHDGALDAEAARQLEHFPSLDFVEARIAAARGFELREGIDCPVLALAAADDMLVPAHCSQILADELACGSVATMDWGGHACNVTDPATFNRLVLEFLRS